MTLRSFPTQHMVREVPCSCFRYMVSQHPEVEQKLMAELDSLQLSITPQRRHPRKMTYADLNRLTYLQAVIKVASALCTVAFSAGDRLRYSTALKLLYFV